MSPDVVIDGLTYPVVIAADASATLPPLVAERCKRAVIVHDPRVEERAQAIGRGLTAAGVAVEQLVALGGGEHAKRLDNVAKLYEALVRRNADRDTWLVAIGGGTTSDVAGFAAATYLRGIPWAAVPTTVLAMADAAIGGKTGVDLPQGKNLVGSFWDPSAVVADLAALATLPDRERRTGLAETIKCAIIAGPGLLDRIASRPSDAPVEWWRDVIAGAARVKAAIVGADPRERGRRAVLNLGHTVGHALEVASNYRLAHGEAVAVGIRAAGIISRSRGAWSTAEHVRILNVMRSAGLPVFAKDAKLESVMAGLTHDKKNTGGRLRFVLPFAIGDVREGIEVDRDAARDAVLACLAPPNRSELAG